ncbi:general substrate transporter [Phlegmacium glaucopus]|nr:general substrate transporter [Phlegmacium glaucopus]
MPTGASCTTYAHLLDPNRNWYNNKRLIILNFWILLLLITSWTNAYDAVTFSSLQSLPRWKSYFNNPAGGSLSLLNISQTVGALVAVFISPYVADSLGRRTCVLIGAVIMCIATAFQAGAHSLDMFIGARFLVGFGLNFATTAAPILIAEIAYPPHRAPLTSAYGSLWYSGAIAATWSIFGAATFQTSWSWRLPSIFQSIPSVLQVALIWFGPESPRWLISKNRNAEALKTLAYYHADGNLDDPLVRFEYDEIRAAINREVSAKLGWKTLFVTTPGKLRLQAVGLLAFISPWYIYPFSVVLINAGITNPDVQLLITGIFQIWSLFWALLAASLVDKVGRRTLFLTSVAGAVVCFSLLTPCSIDYSTSGHKAAAYAYITFIFLFYSFFNLAFPTLIVSYAVEIFPYSLRAKGFACFNFNCLLASIISSHVHLPFGLGPFYWNIFYVVMVVGQGLFLWKFIYETKCRTLEKAGIVYDDDGTTEQVVCAAQNSSTTLNSKEDHDEKRSEICIE